MMRACAQVRSLQPEEGLRKSDWLTKVWQSHNRNQFPFCALHCLMQMIEAMFMMITQRCLKNEPETAAEEAAA
jgi:hypothetical protein